MKLQEIVDKLGLRVKTKTGSLQNEINHGYASDLLSDVLANAREGALWITMQIHQNIVPVASVKDLAGIIIINGREPEKETLKRADHENIPVMVSNLSAFELIGRLYTLGLSGTNDEAKGV